MRLSYAQIFGSSRLLLVVFFTLFASIFSLRAETVTEDFETVTLVDAEGQPLASQYSWGYGLSNGWKIIGGTIYASAGTTNYGLWSLGHESSRSLESSFSATNTACVFIPVQLQGDIRFWVRKTSSSSSTKGYVTIYEATEDGTVTANKLMEATLTSTAWTEQVIEGVKGKYIAINLVRAALDDFSAEAGDGSGVVVAERRALTVTSFTRTSDYAVTADEANQFTASFHIKVKNTGNVDLTASEVSVSVVNRDTTVVYATATATEGLTVDGEAEIAVSVSADAGDGGSIAFYALENQTRTLAASPQYVSVVAYKPQFAILGPDGWTLYSDETIAFGTTQTGAERKVTIRNGGTAPLAITAVAVPEGFTASDSSFSVEAGAQRELTIALTPAEPYGQKSGTVTIEHALGTFSFLVTGTTVAPALFFEDFEAKELPASWTSEGGWKVTSQSGNYYAQQGGTSAQRLITPKLSVAQGQKMTFEARRAYSYDTSSQLTVYYSADQQEWQQAFTCPSLSSSFTVFTVGSIPAGDYYVAFEGISVALDNVAGYQVAGDTPQLTVRNAQGTVVTGEGICNFGTVTKDSTVTYVVENTGTGLLSATLSCEGDYTLSKQEMTLAAGETDTVAVTLVAQPYGDKAGTLTIQAAGSVLTVALQGLSRDPEIIYVDFQDQQWPRGWLADGKWSVSHESFSSTEYYAEHYDYTSAVSGLTTSLVKVLAGDVLTFDARSYGSYSHTLRISRSTDRSDWQPVADLTSQLTEETATFRVENLPEGECYLRFEGANVVLDNITGLHLAAAPEHQVVITQTTMPAECEVNHPVTLSATVCNLWADTEEVTAVLLIDDVQVGDPLVKTVGRNDQTTFAFSYTPHRIVDAMKARIVLTYAGQTLQTEEQTIRVVEESDDQYAHIVSGWVYDADWQPMEGVHILLVSRTGDAQYEGTTDKKGAFSIRVVQGLYAYTLTATMEGYDTYSEVIGFGGSDVTGLEISLLHPGETVGVATVKGGSGPVVRYDLRGFAVKGQQRGGIQVVNGKKILKK